VVSLIRVGVKFSTLVARPKVIIDDLRTMHTMIEAVWIKGSYIVVTLHNSNVTRHRTMWARVVDGLNVLYLVDSPRIKDSRIIFCKPTLGLLLGVERPEGLMQLRVNCNEHLSPSLEARIARAVVLLTGLAGRTGIVVRTVTEVQEGDLQATSALWMLKSKCLVDDLEQALAVCNCLSLRAVVVAIGSWSSDDLLGSLADVLEGVRSQVVDNRLGGVAVARATLATHPTRPIVVALKEVVRRVPHKSTSQSWPSSVGVRWAPQEWQ
jgi:hypothetical protein